MNNPPSHVPADLSRNHPLDEGHGQWFVDRNDGWRFFVPKSGTTKYSEKLLLGEVDKVTNSMTARAHSRQNVCVTVLYMLAAFVCAPLAVMSGWS